MRALQLHVVLALAALLATVGVRRRADDTRRITEGERLVDCAVRAAELRADRVVRVEASGGEVAVGIRGDAAVSFVGGRAAEELLADLSELAALRTFEANDSADYGLDDARLRIECAERTEEWSLGASPPGSADRYLGGSEGVVHLIDGALVRALEEAEVRLMRRALHDFEESAVARVRVALPERTVELEQRFGDDPRRRRWVDPDEPGARAPAFDRLMGTERNLRAEAGAEAVDSEPLATMVFLDDDEEPLGSLDLHSVGAGPGALYVVRTDDIGWVRVPRSTGRAFARALERLP